MADNKRAVLKRFFWLWVCCQILLCLNASADPVTFYQSFAGNLNYQGTGGTLRTSDGNPCAVVNSGSASLSGIPASATVSQAYLYWAGSGSTVDSMVTFNSNNITADRIFVESDTPVNPTRYWFAGFKNVTTIVQGKIGGPNGTYTFSNLTVDNGGDHCNVATVLAGWALIVVYEDAAEPLRVINFFDGLQNFWGSSITLVPSNFQVPNNGIDGKFGVLTWEGDKSNSDTRNSLNEDLRFNGVLLTDPPLNPNQNQYNSTISPLNAQDTYGVDLDFYDVSTLLSPGQTSATLFYSTGQDRVLLSLEVISVTNTPVADLFISKSHTGNFVSGQQGVYTITVSNNGPNATSAGSTITVTDTLPAGLSYVSASGSGWSCGAAGQVVTCTQAGVLASGASYPAISLTVNVSAAAAPSVTNTATVSTNSTTFDNQSSNNTASDPTNVLVPNLSTSTKSVLDLNGGDANPGDRLRYTITLIESGGASVNGVRVTDTINGLLTNFTVTNNGGGTDNSTPGSGPLDIAGISVAASSSVTVVFEVDITGTAIPGNVIDNTAVINNPVTSSNTNAVAPNVTVSASVIPGAGVKRLYPYFNTTTLSRIVPVTATTSLSISGLGGSLTLPLTPVTQTALTLGSGNIQIPLCLDRSNNNGGSGRDIAVSLDYVGGSVGVIGNQTRNGILTTDGYQIVTFNINLAANLALNSNTAVRLRVTNNSPNTNSRIQITSLDAGCATVSNVSLNSNTVINVDSVNGYDNVAYPGGTVQPSYLPGEIVRIRAIVRDPFGSFDITTSRIQIFDPNANLVVPTTTMTQVNDSGAATKTYEYIFTVPAAGPNGYWTAQVTANEGTEGTISDLGVGTFRVGRPLISVMKLSSTYSDPVNNPSYPGSDAGANPKAIPGAIVEYQLVVTNSGVGRTDNNSIVITDALPSQVRLFFGNPVNPLQFSNGTPSSGLTFTFNNLADTTDDVAFSNNGGSTFITPTVDANGFDITVPFINFIRINPKGRLSGSIGSGNPSFSIIFRGRVQ